MDASWRNYLMSLRLVLLSARVQSDMYKKKP